MIAIVLCAGNGTRVQHLTNGTPKCLIDIAGRPALDHLLDWLRPIASEIRLVIQPAHYEAFELYELDCNVYFQDEPLGEAHAAWSAMQDMKYSKNPVLIALGKKIPVGFHSRLVQLQIMGCPTHCVIPTRNLSSIENTTWINATDKGYIRDFVEIRDGTIQPGGEVRTGIDYIDRADYLYEAIRLLMQYKRTEYGEYRLTTAYRHMLRHGSRFKTVPLETLSVTSPATICQAEAYFRHSVIKVSNGQYEIHRACIGHNSKASGWTIPCDVPLGKILFPEAEERDKGIATFPSAFSAHKALAAYIQTQ